MKICYLCKKEEKNIYNIIWRMGKLICLECCKEIVKEYNIRMKVGKK